jgi:hypothetical protein
MYRRRNRQRAEIAFSFDSFLDMVANVCGIIIRLILVAWVGGRSYSALMQMRDDPPPPAATKAAPRAQDDPLSRQIRETQQQLEAARAKLLAQLHDLDFQQQSERTLQAQLASLQIEQQKLAKERESLVVTDEKAEKSTRLVALSMEELQRRQKSLLDEIKKVETQPAPKKELRYRTPVSRAVHADEVFFECQNGRVTFIDLQAFLQEVQSGLEGKGEELRNTWKVEATTRAVGPFRLRYVVERRQQAVDEFGGSAKPSAGRSFSYGVSEWAVEPLDPLRGETLEAALAAGSEFRRVVEGFDPTTVITFWVYPDSFEQFRRLRDYVYDRGLEVAGRPLQPGFPIAATKQGSASRGQ